MVSGLVLAAAQPLTAVADSAVLADSGDPSVSSRSDAGQQETPESLAVAEARRSGKDVNVASLQSETSDVVAKPDGRLAATIHTKPVRTRKDGSWRAIDTSLRTTSGGAVVPSATLTDMEFSGGGTQPLVRMSSAGKELKLTWPKPLPTPVISGSTAEYRSILPDVDLRMTATDSGFTQLIVVKTPEAAKNPELDQLKLGMSSADLTVRKETDGSLSMVDKAAGGTVFQAPKPMMFDSSPGLTDGSGMPATPTAQLKALAAPKNALATVEAPADPSAHTAAVDVAVPADQTSLILTPDQKLLDAPSTVFPVMIDPDVNAPRAVGWAGISRYWSDTSFWKFSGDFGMGYCGDEGRCVPADVKRVLYAIPVKNAPFVGKHIQDAKFRAWNSHSWSCTPQPVDLFLTGRIGSSTTWSNSSSMGSSSFWNKYLATRNDARGFDGCGAGFVEFEPAGLRDAVQAVADRNTVDLTLGLKAGSESASAYGQWKRFTDDGYLQVFYNLPPRQPAMKDLSSQPGGVCSSTTTPITKVPQVYARVSDPDQDSIGVQFALVWDTGSWYSTGGANTPPASNTFRASGSTFSLQLPSGTPLNKPVGWAVRAWDGAEWGPWSWDGAPTGCYFTVDTSKPAGPVTTSLDFPGSHDGQAALAWTDGVGRYGTFTFTTASRDAVAFQWGLDQQPTAAQEVASSGGAARSVRVLMPSEGPHILTARAKDAAGNAGETTTYYFNVRRGQAPRAGWAMNDTPGSMRLASGPAANFPATLTGGTLGAAGHTGTAAALTGETAPDGTPKNYLSTQSAVLETDQSFTVSAWVNTADPSVQFQSAVSQSSVHQAAVTLGLSSGKWTVKAPTADNATDYGWYTASSDVAPVANQWTHLAGVYNAVAKTLTVYVNGKPSTPAQGVSLWSARGAMDFGRLRWRDTYTDPWKGSLDDVRVYDRALGLAEMTDLAAGRQVITGMGAKAVWSLDESGTTADGASEIGDLTTTGAVQMGISDGIEDKAVRFGADGYATTSRPQVDGTRSFSVSAWVRRPALAAGDSTAKVAVSQPGAHQPEFSLYYSPSYKKWIFGRSAEDSTADTLVRAVQPACTAPVNGVPCFGATNNEWTHLVGVSDAVTHKIRLYINGYLVDESDYIQSTPWATTKPLMIAGLSREGTPAEFLGGDVDDVRIFDRIVTGDEARTMVQQRPQLAARWKFNTGTATTPPVSAADGPLFPASLYGGASVSTTDQARVGTGTLTLNGSTGFAQTSATPLDTGQSFTLAGWAQSAAPPNRDMTVLSLGGDKGPAVTVRWKFLRTSDDPVSPGNIGEWQVETVDGAAKHAVVVHTFDGSQSVGSYWNHLAVTYDAFSNELALYVNGQRENEICPDADASCTPHVSFTTADQPLKATQELRFGRNPATVTNADWFSGQIDDVWAYQGVLSPAGITQLAQGDELDSRTGPAT
ncbi:concanavalin A-like lectin/glucanase superfamily protein [Streptomyces sp. TLI_146]|nr:concanavalin A-like lectin/glucanase superfamily protein [Streptomyces sp. TLI_146]